MLEIGSLAELKREVFGPVLHVLRYPAAGLPQVIEQINATGYGLTHGIHTRIDEKVEPRTCAASAPATSTSTATSSVRWSACSRSAATASPAPAPRRAARSTSIACAAATSRPSCTASTVPVAFDALRALQAGAARSSHDLRPSPAPAACTPASGCTGRLAAERAASRCPGRPARTTGCGSSPAARSPASARPCSSCSTSWPPPSPPTIDVVVPDDDLGRRLVRTIGHPDIAFAPDPAARRHRRAAVCRVTRCRRRLAAAARRPCGGESCR